MGRRGSWFSAIRRVFVPSSKEKSADNGQEKKRTKEKKKSRGILRPGEATSFIPFFREPSSIEKILGEVDEEKLFRPPISSEQQKSPPFRPTSPRIVSPEAASPPRATTSRSSPPKASSSSMPFLPRVASPRASPPRTAHQKVVPPKAPFPRVIHNRKEISFRPEPTLKELHISATKIQAGYRGYRARRSFRALRGLVRLQGVIRGQNVKRQTMNAMKQMQLLVRVQTQIQSRRIQMLENQALQRQAYQNNRDVESTLSKWTYNQLVDGSNVDWDDSVLTKEERETRLRKKVEAVIKRERAMTYAYSHQLWKPHPKSSQADLDERSSGFPWWWNWLERQLPSANASESQTPIKNAHPTPPRLVSDHKKPSSPWIPASSYKLHNYVNDEQLTPRSSKSSMLIRGKQMHTPNRTLPPPSSSNFKKSPRPRASANGSRFDVPMKDDDSLTSCPPFSVPSYMQPTVSAKAKVRASSNPKERLPGTPGNGSNRRFSFPLTPNIGSFKWNKGSSKDSTSQRINLQSIDDRSVGSAVSMPAAFGRKPFNRFV